MTQIENLIVVEVPKGSKWKVSDEYIYRWHGDHIGWMADSYNQLPFPCEIIGLASEVGNDWQIMGVVLDLAGNTGIKYTAPNDDWFNRFAYQNSLTSPDKDYLFLKRKG